MISWLKTNRIMLGLNILNDTLSPDFLISSPELK